MIDLRTEHVELINELARENHSHASTFIRWITKGSRGVRLEAIRLGGRWFSSRAALQRFAQALTPLPGNDPALRPPTPSQQKRGSQKAAEELRKLGF